MAFKQVKEFNYITIAEAKEIMEEIAKEREKSAELLFETRRALHHLRMFSKLPAKEAKKLVEELMSLSQIWKIDMAVKLVDIMPHVPDEVRTVFAKERFTLTQEQIKEILEVIDKYR
jgi:DNA-directed RNA polymerase subunit F